MGKIRRIHGHSANSWSFGEFMVIRQIFPPYSIVMKKARNKAIACSVFIYKELINLIQGIVFTGRLDFRSSTASLVSIKLQGEFNIVEQPLAILKM